MSEYDCMIEADRAWLGQWHCTAHDVWFRADVESECCPAGAAHARGRAEALDEAAKVCDREASETEFPADAMCAIGLAASIRALAEEKP